MAAPPDHPDLQHAVPLVPAPRSAPSAPPEPSDPPPPAARRWPWAVGGLVIGLLTGGVVGAIALSSTTVITQPPVERVVTVTVPAPAPETPEPAAGPLTAFGAGVWEVGVDITPGKYKTAGTDGYGCYYARLQNNDGSLDDIISNGFSEGPVTVTIKDSDGYFETSGCADWGRA